MFRLACVYAGCVAIICCNIKAMVRFVASSCYGSGCAREALAGMVSTSPPRFDVFVVGFGTSVISASAASACAEFGPAASPLGTTLDAVGAEMAPPAAGAGGPENVGEVALLGWALAPVGVALAPAGAGRSPD